VEPCTFVILGATGDLTHRKLLPALYHLFLQGEITGKFAILGVALESMDDKQFRDLACKSLGSEAGSFCSEHVQYQTIGHGEPSDFQALAARLESLEHTLELPANRVLYLALPPEAVPATITKLGDAGLNHSSGWTRLVIEKPFGRDLASARQLNALIHRYYNESQVYRIDHYLGKETVQNLLVFRYSNALFETVWNRDRVEAVEITVAETLGVEHRAGYYEQAGAVRDMVQNHLTQLMAVTAMELPATFDPEAIRYERIKVLKAVCPIKPENVVLGQYARGAIDGHELPAYREEPGVAADSQTETFAALKLEIANWRWDGVPFYLRTGKRLPQQVSQIAVTFRPPPISIFQSTDGSRTHPNALIIKLQPDEGFDLRFGVKTPGRRIQLETERLHFRYSESFAPLADAYETLLLDVIEGDPTLFVSADWEEASWSLYTPLLENKAPVKPYAAGTWGPLELPRKAWSPRFLE
jgi:glucose-6-phosphate 1-dehydrogenase